MISCWLCTENLVDHTESAMKQDVNLKEKWLDCFPQEEVDAKLVSLLLERNIYLQPWSQGLEKNHSIHISPLPTPVQC